MVSTEPWRELPDLCFPCLLTFFGTLFRAPLHPLSFSSGQASATHASHQLPRLVLGTHAPFLAIPLCPELLSSFSHHPPGSPSAWDPGIFPRAPIWARCPCITTASPLSSCLAAASLVACKLPVSRDLSVVFVLNPQHLPGVEKGAQNTIWWRREGAWNFTHR